jgi:hypothetical protein
MGQINLDSEPEFRLPVKIPRLGQEAAEVQFTFKHRTVDEFAQLETEAQAPEFTKVSDEELVLMVASGWGLKDEFTQANVRALCQKYPGAAFAVWKAYMDEYTRARLGN